jgi:hypothetical protein
MNWKYGRNWLFWSLLSVSLLVCDFFFYERKVLTGTVDGSVFFALVCSHIAACAWGYKKIVLDFHSKWNESTRYMILMFLVVALFFAYTFNLFERSERLVAMAILMAGIFAAKRKGKRGNRLN